MQKESLASSPEGGNIQNDGIGETRFGNTGFPNRQTAPINPLLEKHTRAIEKSLGLDSNRITYCIDYFNFTLFKLMRLKDILRLLRLPYADAETGEILWHKGNPLPGRSNYKSTFTRMNSDGSRNLEVAVLMEGEYGDGIHVTISGVGCRELDKLWSYNWADLVGTLRAADEKIRCTRIDLAMDVFRNDICVVKRYDKVEYPHNCVDLNSYIVGGHYTSRLAYKLDGYGYNPSKPYNGDSFTHYFGKIKGEQQLRIYEKGLQQKFGPSFPWTRFESQMSREKARYVFGLLADGVPLKKLVIDAISSAVTFRQISTAINKSEVPVASFWSRLFDGAEKMKLARFETPPEEKFLKTLNWLDTSVSRFLTLAVLVGGQDLEWLHYLIHRESETLDDKTLLSYGLNPDMVRAQISQVFNNTAYNSLAGRLKQFNNVALKDYFESRLSDFSDLTNYKPLEDDSLEEILERINKKSKNYKNSKNI